MRSDRAKQFLELDGKPILAGTLEVFQGCTAIDGVILVVPEESIEYCQEKIVEPFELTKVLKVVKGGARRQDSVRLGIDAIPEGCERVVVHDGVRPLVDPEFIEMVVVKADKDRAVITGLPAKETIKGVGKEGQVLNTYDRRQVWMIQTPQVFRYEDIKLAHERALHEGWEDITDDALLLEKIGIPVKVVEGMEYNIKITTPFDLELARLIRANG